MKDLENKFVTGAWVPSFLTTASLEPPKEKRKQKQKNMEIKQGKKKTETKQNQQITIKMSNN